MRKTYKSKLKKWKKPVVTRIALDPAQAVLVPCVVGRTAAGWPAVWYNFGTTCRAFAPGGRGSEEGYACSVAVKGDRYQSTTNNAIDADADAGLPS